ncbi:hypothetical protein ABH945_004130 [Paraburkholderia sp. GAS333]
MLNRTVVCLTLSCILAACTSVDAARYAPSVDNLQALKSLGPVEGRIEPFDAPETHDNPYPVFLRAARMHSPVGGSFGTYLSNAMEQEFAVAGDLSSHAKFEVSGVLLKNDIDALGFSQGQGIISARFVVRRGSDIVYDSVKTAIGNWDSSLLGFVAVTNATQAYPQIVQTLLAKLYADPVFRSAIH